MNQSIHFVSPIGPLSIITSQAGICYVRLYETESNQELSANSLLTATCTQFQEYFKGIRKEFSVVLDKKEICGFQKDVLDITSNIGFGELLTYGQIAALLHKPGASRAVGSALAHNPLPILIPCHRVVAANGHLTGYLGQKGIETKKWLLELEGHKVVGEKLV